jgi:hypothetical protein
MIIGVYNSSHIRGLAMNKYFNGLCVLLVFCFSQAFADLEDIFDGLGSLKEYAKGYALIYGGIFSAGAAYATKEGFRGQKKQLGIAEKKNDKRLKYLVTRWRSPNPILMSNCFIAKEILRTVPITFPLAMSGSMAYMTYKDLKK